jgi:tetratricopeptide (TPR) repeat protein/mono/diheme cytochrome c family protein
MSRTRPLGPPATPPATAPVALIVAAVAVAACGGEGSARPRATLEPTFAGGVARVLHESCAACHREGGAGPFPLLTYEQAREHGRRIASMTASGEMPPWPPSRPVGVFVDERRLAEEEVELLQRWVSDGMPLGDPESVPAPPEWSGGWQLGTPDLVLEMERAYVVPADTGEIFRNFVLPVPSESLRWIRAVEFQPGSPSVVHHATLAIDRTRGSRNLDAADAEPGFDGMGSGGGAEHPAGVFIGWTPGRSASGGPEGVSWRLEPGSDVVARLHLRPIDEPVEVRSRVGLYFADGPPERVPVVVQLGAQSIRIPAGEAAYEVRDSLTLPVDVDVLSLYPHAHYLGDVVQAWADAPSGERVWLLEIPDWDFNWQDEYRFAEPLRLAAGTVLHMRYTYDNTATNPHQPHDPPVRVTHGPRSVDEMADLVVQTLPSSREGASELQRVVDRKAAEIKLDGYRLALEERGEEAATLYNMAIVEASLGRGADAEVHFREAIRMDPGFVDAFINLGIVLHQQGRIAEAADLYARAAGVAPDEPRAYHNLGVALQDLGRVQESEPHFRRALEADSTFALSHKRLAELLRARGDLAGAVASYRRSVAHGPDDVEARMALGSALAQSGDGVGALESFRAVAERAPDSPQPLLAMAELLAAYPDASVRQPAEAIRLAARAVELTRGNDAVALLTLSVAHAAAGDFRQAVTVGEQALAVARQGGPAGLVQAIQARIERYRQGRS